MTVTAEPAWELINYPIPRVSSLVLEKPLPGLANIFLPLFSKIDIVKPLHSHAVPFIPNPFKLQLIKVLAGFPTPGAVATTIISTPTASLPSQPRLFKRTRVIGQLFP
ncbi:MULTISPECIES: hypothetical protein [unclassified Coleofasciculus]|uniref:hypothetical protein n=1 Tax=unclassified Coleofasciculus TaxID=2692782 RepID=UPI00187FAE0F|nr:MULTISPECIES: hypothetical protein [unclassified Coleofasciculus]MBE9130055.1 hypothetical protein [Coleofasciculus sp. LEGE 07081]MBE9152439.1 hypothetical protein [Coleofasciculus sp. LEGE 07092]